MSKDCTIQDVFHRFYSSFESTHSISPAQRKAAYHIMNCKTGAFGVNVSVCEDCGCISVHYNSCRDRCCPMCQEFPKEKCTSCLPLWGRCPVRTLGGEGRTDSYSKIAPLSAEETILA